MKFIVAYVLLCTAVACGFALHARYLELRHARNQLAAFKRRR